MLTKYSDDVIGEQSGVLTNYSDGGIEDQCAN